jgi:hypothetical protein
VVRSQSTFQRLLRDEIKKNTRYIIIVVNNEESDSDEEYNSEYKSCPRTRESNLRVYFPWLYYNQFKFVSDPSSNIRKVTR